MTLREQQALFAQYVGKLLTHAYEMGYELSLGEALRSPQEAAYLASQGKGIPHSLHIISLAIDLNLFKDGVYLGQTSDHCLLGEWWEAQHPLCRWGGRFKDGNHYSMEWDGRK